MSRLSQFAVLLIAGGCATTSAKQQETIPTDEEATGEVQAQETPQGFQGQAQPPTSPPQQQPALPASIPPIPTEAQTTATTGQVQTTEADQGQGQWVYTQQYGWIWMPYSDNYIYTPDYSSGGYPYQYVYYPSYGWTWLVAPWVWGFGIQPFFVFGGFHHHFFVEHERFEHEGFRGERFRGGFHQPAGFRAPITRTAPGHVTGHAMGGHPVGGHTTMAGGFHGEGGFHGGEFHGGGFHGGGFHGGGFHGGAPMGGGFHGGGGGFHGGGMGGGFHGGGGMGGGGHH